jgi:ribosomal subunit interface protein
MASRSVDPGVVGCEPPAGFQLDVRAHGFSLTEAVRRYATDHLAAKLAKHAAAIQTVVIRLGDENGAKGGEDKSCEIELSVRTGALIVVRATNHDLNAAIDEVGDRVQNALGRELDRQRERPRQRGRRAARARKTLH